ncbi:MAG: GTPase HflX [Bryobacteraceae bacterium]|nr:GTPase HflX [Bryobacteraceae bacterium]
MELTARRKSAPPASPALSAEESLAELAVLAASAGAEVRERILQQRPSFDSSTLVGSGKLEELQALVNSREADLVIFDHELGGMQQRNLEKALGCRVVDRTQLILDIFARRARTREGQLQVELAQLNYLLPRLTGRGTSMSRLGGGIGTRGPGETQLETDRRRIHKRIKRLEDDLEAVRGSRGIQRRQRQAVPLLTLALAGYTNAGKSTLFNRLTTAGVLADARMFATLDPTVRQVTLPSRRRVLLSDTVGFIRQLPTTLVKAFRATLEEVVEAALILHIVDASAPGVTEHCSHVREVLAEIGAEKTPQLLVLNKCDALPPELGDREAILQRLKGEAGGLPAVWVSARTGEGLADLLRCIDQTLPDDPVAPAVFRFPPDEYARVSFLHEYAQVRSERYTGEGCIVEADAPLSVRRRLAAFEVQPET